MTVGGSGFGVLEYKQDNGDTVRIAYLAPMRGDAKVPSQMDNRCWEFYEIWNTSAWISLIADPWSTPPGNLETGLIIANARKRLVLKKIIRNPQGEMRSYVYDLAGTTLKLYPAEGAQVMINGQSMGKQLFFDTGADNIKLDWKEEDDGKTVNDPVETMAEAIYHANAAQYSLKPRSFSEIPERGQKVYRMMATAALEAIRINNWPREPRKHECPVCEMDWRAAGEHNLDRNWVPSP